MLENIFGDREQADLKREFLGLRGREPTEREQVPYSRQAGIVWRVSEKLLVTGFDIPAIDCCVVVVFGKDKAGMMHISPNTLPEDFVISSGERYRVSNTDVDKQYSEVLSRLGTLPLRVVIVGGDPALASELAKLVSGQDSAWGGVMSSPGVGMEKVDLGSYGKEVIADPKRKLVFVAEYKLGKFADGRSVVKI